MLVPVGPGDRAALEPMVRAYYAEDGLAFDERRQGAALAALLDGDPLCLAWLVRLGGATIGYVVVTLASASNPAAATASSTSSSSRQPMRGRGIGAKVLALVEQRSPRAWPEAALSRGRPRQPARRASIAAPASSTIGAI